MLRYVVKYVHFHYLMYKYYAFNIVIIISIT